MPEIYLVITCRCGYHPISVSCSSATIIRKTRLCNTYSINYYATLLIAKGRLANNLKLWWHPPTNEVSTSKPSPEAYYPRRLFLWMPRLMWKMDFKCTGCPTKHSLWSKGIYNNVRIVLDHSDYYYLAWEYMECSVCHCTYAAWDRRIMDQMTDSFRLYFPAVLTRKYACDISVTSLLWSRTNGNSPTALRNKIKELHSEQWLTRQLRYFADCDLN